MISGSGAGSQSRGAFDNAIYLFFKFYCPATGAGVVGSCPRKGSTFADKLNWQRAISEGKIVCSPKRKLSKIVVRFFFAEDVVKPTLSVSLHAWLYFPCEIIFRVGTILSADGTKPVVFSSLSRRQVNMA